MIVSGKIGRVAGLGARNLSGAVISRLTVALVLLLGCSMTSAEIVVIANNAATSKLNKEQVANIFLGKRMVVPWGGDATPIDLPETDPLRERFYNKITGKSAAETKSYWARLVFTGMGFPPRMMKSDIEVRNTVATTRGAIGYIDQSAVNDSVRVVYAE